MRTNTLLGLIACLSLCGCGGDQPSSAQSHAMIVAFSASSKAQSMVMHKLDGTDSASINETVTSPDGGTATLVGSATRAADGSASFHLTMTFVSWHEGADTLSGTLTTDMSVVSQNPINMTARLSGSLVVTGDSSGTFSIDLTAKDVGGSATICGTVDGTSLTSPAGATC